MASVAIMTKFAMVHAVATVNRVLIIHVGHAIRIQRIHTTVAVLLDKVYLGIQQELLDTLVGVMDKLVAKKSRIYRV